MTPWQWALLPLRKYASFEGRAPRPEFWWFHLLGIVAFAVALAVDQLLPPGWVIDDLLGPTSILSTLALLLPWLGACVRRLHDGGKSGWHVLVIFLPYIGALWLLYLLARPSDWGPNRYGDHPQGLGAPGMLVEPVIRRG